MAAESHEFNLENTYLYHQLDEYPWDSDEEFQSGLRAILGSVQDPAQVDHLTLRAKCYYYARKAGTVVDFDGYRAWVETQREDAPTNGTGLSSGEGEASTTSGGGGAGIGGMGDAPKPATFAEICELIAEGKPIPGIKDIPDTILEDQGTASLAQKRLKPWERDTTTNTPNAPTWMS